MSPLRLALGALVAGLLTAGLVLGSALPYAAAPGGQALVRLSWRAVGERVEACRVPSAEELAALPPHMRQSRICEGRLAPFHLVVSVDADRVLDVQLEAAGARDDRPTHVFHEIPLAAGEHRLRIHFAPAIPEDADVPGPAPLTLDAELRLAPRQVLLVRRRDAGLEIAQAPRGRAQRAAGERSGVARALPGPGPRD